MEEIRFGEELLISCKVEAPYLPADTNGRKEVVLSGLEPRLPVE